MAKKAINIYSHTTFTVERVEPGKIAFSSGADMWNGLIWGNISLDNIFPYDITGNEDDAKKIENLLNTFYKASQQPMIASKLGITQEEIGLIDNIFNTVGLPMNTKGNAFEQAMTALVMYLFNELNKEDINVGTAQVGSIRFDAGQTDLGLRKFRSLVLQNAKKQSRTDIRALVYRIEGQWKKGELRDVYVRTALRQGKIDLFAGGIGTTLSSVSPLMENLAKLIVGHTFSLKNQNSSSVHLGDPDIWRTLPAFYFAATRDGNFSNLARFLFVNKADENKGDSTVISYQRTAEAIYELTGVGLNTGGLTFSSHSTRAVDYLLVLNPGPVVKVRSTRSIVEKLINQRSSFSFSGNLNVDNY